jgi:hypothetical protein
MSEELQTKATEEAPNQQEPEKTVFDVSREAANLAEKQAQLSSLERDLDQKMEEVGDFQEMLASAKKDPVAFTESLGISYNDYTDEYLKKVGSEPQNESEVVLRKIENLESQIQEAQFQREEDQQSMTAERQQAAYASALKEVKGFVSENPEKFDLIENIGVHDVVLTVIGQHYQSTGEILDTKEACQAVQDHYESEAERYLASDRLLTKLGLSKKEKQRVQQENSPKTLTNNIGTKAPRYTDERPISREESLEAAASKLRWV